MKNLTSVYFFGNGNVVALRGEKQVCRWQKSNAFLHYLQYLVDEGAIGPDTLVWMHGWNDNRPMTAGELWEHGRLKA